MEELRKAMGLMVDVYPKIRAIENREAFMAFIGTVLDSWSVDHGMTEEESVEMLEDLVEVRKMIFATDGYNLYKEEMAL